MTYRDKTSTNSGKPKFEFITTSLCLDFCNTVNLAIPEPNERIRTYQDLVLWGEMAGILSPTEATVLYASSLGHPITADQTLRAALELRASLHRLFVDVARKVRPVLTDIDILNKALEDSLSRQRILFDPTGFRLDWEQTTHLGRMIWPVVTSAVELLTGNNLGLLRQCSGQGCSWLFMDTTRNHSRRWCSMEVCGNRAKARRFIRAASRAHKITALIDGT